MKQINTSHKRLSLATASGWPINAQIILILGISSLIIILGYCWMIQSTLVRYKLLQVQEMNLKADFERKQSQIVNLMEYRQQLHTLNERFMLLLKQLPRENEMPELLEDISKAGRTSGLKFSLFAPHSEIDHGFYVVLPIKIAVEGNYFQLIQFLNYIAKMSRIITLHDFKIERRPLRHQQAVWKDKLVMNVTVKIYRYRV